MIELIYNKFLFIINNLLWVFIAISWLIIGIITGYIVGRWHQHKINNKKEELSIKLQSNWN